ncbi:MAG: MFS transporter [Candidatus Lokiarchaeota archaeon]|nr:MFS transporter [Candidatus Lokiarchaeota archaeon]
MTSLSNNTMTRKEKWVYLLMVIPFYLMAAAYFLTIYEFFHDYLLLDDKWFYIASIIYMVVNAINDPILAMWSDSIDPKKWGSRRLIFIRWGGVFWAMSFAFTFLPWSLTNQVVIFIQYTTFMCLLDNGLSLVIMCWMALLPEMESNNDNRIKMSYYTGISIFFASIIGSVIVFIKDLSWIYFRYLTFGIGAFVIIATFITTSLIQERTQFHYEKPLPFWKGLGKTFRMKSFMLYVGYNLFFNVIPMGFGISFVYLYILVIPGLNQTTYFILTSIGMFFAPWIALKLKQVWGMKRTILIVGSFVVFGTILFYLSTIYFKSSILALIGLLFMSWISAIPRAYTSTLTALSMDEFEVKYGNRRETTFLGVNALITKPGDSVGTIIVTAILTATSYIEGGSTEIQPVSALNGIKTFMLLIPALFMLVGLMFIVFHPLYGKKLIRLEQEIERIHAEKKEHLTAIKTQQEEEL